MTISREKCVACRADAPTLTQEEIAALRPQVPDWEVTEQDGVPRLRRVFRTKDFMQALDLANRVGRAAEDEGHHPRLTVDWGRLTVEWWTHKIKGLHRNDFVMAAKTDEMAAR